MATGALSHNHFVMIMDDAKRRNGFELRSISGSEFLVISERRDFVRQRVQF
ncbi:hypothetical protein J6590_091960 [Homalodisca vitripennis]|nr:hypothetical protein J6590_091960 [Homalodisca vitripennis]